jgi:hypothetical protein
VDIFVFILFTFSCYTNQARQTRKSFTVAVSRRNLHRRGGFLTMLPVRRLPPYLENVNRLGESDGTTWVNPCGALFIPEDEIIISE